MYFFIEDNDLDQVANSDRVQDKDNQDDFKIQAFEKRVNRSSTIAHPKNNKTTSAKQNSKVSKFGDNHTIEKESNCSIIKDEGQ